MYTDHTAHTSHVRVCTEGMHAASLNATNYQRRDAPESYLISPAVGNAAGVTA